MCFRRVFLERKCSIASSHSLLTKSKANGTVGVFNSCELGGQEIAIEGTATPLNENLGYGEEGVLRVQFPGTPAPDCPGPNYIVQGMSVPSIALLDLLEASKSNANTRVCRHRRRR